MWALVISLIVIALLLLAVELLIIPGFGVTGVLSIITFVVSCYLSFYHFGTMCGFIVLIAEVLLILLLLMFVLRSKTWKKAALNTNIDSKVDKLPEEKGICVGTEGVTLTRLAPAGSAQFGGITLEVFSKGSIIGENEQIRVVAVDGSKVYVVKVI